MACPFFDGFEGRKWNMAIENIIEKIRGIAIEANDYEDVNTNIIIKRNDDGTYTEVTTDEDN